MRPFGFRVIYPLFLYANFSGYIDIVIAMARLMRVRLPENFDRPFSASSVIDFWNRWHITLSNWLKTYVFNPLLVALMRRISSVALQPFLAVFCFFVTFFLIGLWHGRTSEFIVFGMLTGGGMSINKLWQIGLARAMGRKGYRELAKHPIYVAFGRGLNFVWFAFTLFWFWGRLEADRRNLLRVASRRVARGLDGSVAGGYGGIGAVGMAARSPFVHQDLPRDRCSSAAMRAWSILSVLGLTSFVITVLLNQPAPPIVYKAF